MKATGRVNSPSNKSKPPKVSIMPPARKSGGRCGIGNGAGKPNNFCVPCTMYAKAAVILRILNRYGDQRFTGTSLRFNIGGAPEHDAFSSLTIEEINDKCLPPAAGSSTSEARSVGNCPA